MPTSSFTSTATSPSSIFSLDHHPPMDRCIDQLHFDVPLISTRRASTAKKSGHIEACAIDTSRSVPFLWERAPGVPKESICDPEEVFTPRPPPGRWPTPNNERNDDDCRFGVSVSDSSDDENDIVLETPQSNSSGKKVSPSDARAPSYLMNRFLPAANALAMLSVKSVPKYSSSISNTRYSSGHIKASSGSGLRSNSCSGSGPRLRSHDLTIGYETGPPSKACGIMVLFPWGVKRAICGLKSPIRSPIRSQTPRVTSIEEMTRGSKILRRSNDKGLGVDDGVSSKAWKSPGWAAPFLDTSRLRRKGATESPRMRPPPRLKPPNEPWLARALNSLNTTR